MRVGLGVGRLAAGELIMAFGYRPVNRDQMMLLPPDLRDWLPPRHFVWFLLGVLEELDLSGFEADRRLGGVGRQGYDPRMLLGLLIYGYSHGERSSRRIEELCSVDVAFRVLCAQDAPDHTTIARFRQVNDAAIAELFAQVLEMAGEAGMGRVGMVAVDGTRVAANASWGRNRHRSWLAEQVDQMMAEAERVDAEEDERFGPDVNGAEVDPEWAAGSKTRKRRIKESLARFEAAVARAEEAAEQQTAAQQERVARWQARRDQAADRLAGEQAAARQRYSDYQQQKASAERDEGPRPTGQPTPPPEQAAGVRRAQASVDKLQARVDTAAAAVAAARAAADPEVNLTDPESGWMPTSKGWIQGYNTQLAVSDDHLIIGCKVTTATVDVNQFEPMLAAAARGAAALDRGRSRAGMAAEPIGLVLADAGYFSADNLTVPGPDRLIAPSRRQRLNQFATNHHLSPGPDADDDQDPLAVMRARFADPHYKLLYRRRGAVVEPVNGHLKDRHGLRQFSRRGQAACQAEVDLACTTANLLKIWRRR
jgi:transposase